VHERTHIILGNVHTPTAQKLAGPPASKDPIFSAQDRGITPQQAGNFHKCKLQKIPCPSFLNWDMKIGRALDHCFREEVDANATK
jgi:hypothetical protein